jgi:hypothetical protein
MWRALAVLVILITTSVMMTTSAAAQNKAAVDSVSVHLFLDKSGSLSKDITTIPNFSTWNFVADGEGIPDREHFHSILIKVRVTAPGEHYAKGLLATVTLTNRETKKIVKRKRLENIYIGSEGATFEPVFVDDAACGPFDLVVSGGGKRIAKSLEIKCGE